MSSGRRTSTALARVPRQLTLDGVEVPHPPRRHHRALGAAAEDALDILTERGLMRAVEVGRALHQRSGCVLEGPRWKQWKGVRSKACCPYAASDGYSALRQLESHTMVEHLEDGRWQALIPTSNG